VRQSITTGQATACPPVENGGFITPKRGWAGVKRQTAKDEKIITKLKWRKSGQTSLQDVFAPSEF